MPYVISDECIACGACASDCPVGAISEGDGKYVIDPDTCIDCGACAGTCPWALPRRAELRAGTISKSGARRGLVPLRALSFA